jgi:[ribosomal protein S18]-alanine N-acetyltransferase
MIRPIKTQDIEQILTIEKLSFSVPWSEEDFFSELKNPRAHYLVFEEKNQLIGYAGFWQVLEEGHITNIAIAPSFQQQGYGKKLIEAMMNYARILKIEQMTLEVRESNVNALKAYSSVGFHIEGRRSQYYTNPNEDAIIMWISLNKED